MAQLITVILAAGLGTRMRSQRAKVLHPLMGRPLVEYPVGLAKALGSDRIICVLGHQADTIRAAIEQRFGAGAVDVAIQAEQRGTGHALQQAAPLMVENDGLLLVLCGDVPLLTEETMRKVVEIASAGILAMVSFTPDDARGYGRVVRDGSGKVLRIVEDRDCTEMERHIRECNAGIYCGPMHFILESLQSLTPDNAQHELYLTDVVARAARQLAVGVVAAPADEVMGVNDRADLARAQHVLRRRMAANLMRAGVTVADPERLHVEPEVLVGQDSELGVDVELRGNTVVGQGCRIDTGAILSNAILGDNVHVKPYCVISDSHVGEGAHVGPFAHLRPGTKLDADVRIGNFVETKKTTIGRGSKANHLSYLGDATIGAGVNVGCGTITCNYDGYKKSQTVIEDGVFIGSDTQLVAPVTVHAGAVVAAGTTVVEDVPAGALALTRAATVHVAGYAEKKRRRMTEGAAPKPTAPPARKPPKAAKPPSKKPKPRRARS